MTIWLKNLTPEEINTYLNETMCEHLGIKVTQIGKDYLEGTMPVDHRTRQSFNILHGGASVALAETLGSLAGNLCVEESSYCVGMEINANHLVSASSGLITGRASPLHLGRSTHVWEIRLYREDHRLICISRHTLAVKSH